MEGRGGGFQHPSPPAYAPAPAHSRTNIRPGLSKWNIGNNPSEEEADEQLYINLYSVYYVYTC